MYHDVSYLLSRLINGPLSLRQIYFASSNGPVPDLAYQVDFPRLEIVLEGEFVDTGAGATLVPGDVLYVAAGGWNLTRLQRRAMGWQTISKSGEATRRPTRPTHRFFSATNAQ